METFDLLTAVPGNQRPLEVLLALLMLAIVVALVIQAILDVGGRKFINRNRAAAWIEDRLNALAGRFNEIGKAKEEYLSRKKSKEAHVNNQTHDRGSTEFEDALKVLDKNLREAEQILKKLGENLEVMPHPFFKSEMSNDDILSVLIGRSKRILHLRPAQVVGRFASGAEALIDPADLIAENDEARNRRTALAVIACQNEKGVSDFTKLLANLSGKDSDAARYEMMQMIESGIDDLQVKMLEAWIRWQYGLAVGFAGVGVILLYRFLQTSSGLDVTSVTLLVAGAISSGLAAVPIRVGLERWLTSIGTQ
ncbi:MAG: hypothetical protein AAGA08_16215 [Pseudomonadota bacterium]